VGSLTGVFLQGSLMWSYFRSSIKNVLFSGVVLFFWGGFLSHSSLAAADRIRVLVWDEQQPRQKIAYPEFLGRQLASHLEKSEKLVVSLASIDDPENGLSTKTLEECDVLIWWGHVRQDEIAEAKGVEIVEYVKRGKLALIILHSAHWSVPFMEAMEQKAVQDALDRVHSQERQKVTVRWTAPRQRKTPPLGQRHTIGTRYIWSNGESALTIEMQRPNCVFPSCCHPAEPSQIRTRLPEHPVARGIPLTFTIPETEMYDEPFGVPEPDLLIFDETWEGGEYFRSGAVWNLGSGKIFYFRPGHETYRVYFEDMPLRIIRNAVIWMGESRLEP